MDRITARTPDGLAYLAKVRPNEQEVEASRHTCECIYESWQRLAAYEDTGLSPENVVMVNDFSQSQRAKLLAENSKLRDELERMKGNEL
ncbi:MAG: hypothetical protein ACK5LX_01000 [Oscillospiraceae bacterium]